MYSFVFLWSPLLISGVQSAGVSDELPFGLIFACFMVCIMVGSSLFSLALSKGFSAHSCLRTALLLSVFALSAPLWTDDWRVLFVSFLFFEIACGVYFPSAGTLRGKVIPERSRSAVMNLFRLPLNGLVVAVLLNIENLSTFALFSMIVAWLLAGLVALHILTSIAVQDLALETKSDEAKKEATM
jgi:hypothetical protein